MYNIKSASVAQWANALAEPQCSGPGWLTRRSGFDSRCRHVKSGFLHAMRLNSWGQVQRVCLYPLKNVTGHHTRIGGVCQSGCGESRQCG